MGYNPNNYDEDEDDNKNRTDILNFNIPLPKDYINTLNKEIKLFKTTCNVCFKESEMRVLEVETP